jgi:hypothetical protein
MPALDDLEAPRPPADTRPLSPAIAIVRVRSGGALHRVHFRHSSPRVPESKGIRGHPSTSTRIGALNTSHECPAKPHVLTSDPHGERVHRAQEVAERALPGTSSPFLKSHTNAGAAEMTAAFTVVKCPSAVWPVAQATAAAACHDVPTGSPHPVPARATLRGRRCDVGRSPRRRAAFHARRSVCAASCTCLGPSSVLRSRCARTRPLAARSVRHIWPKR